MVYFRKAQSRGLSVVVSPEPAGCARARLRPLQKSRRPAGAGGGPGLPRPRGQCHSAERGAALGSDFAWTNQQVRDRCRREPCYPTRGSVCSDAALCWVRADTARPVTRWRDGSFPGCKRARGECPDGASAECPWWWPFTSPLKADLPRRSSTPSLLMAAAWARDSSGGFRARRPSRTAGPP